MPDADASFENAVAINWDKNLVTRSVAATLQLMGYQPETWFRPRLLEDPKLFLICFLLGLGLTMASASFLLDQGVRVITKRPTVSAPHKILHARSFLVPLRRRMFIKEPYAAHVSAARFNGRSE